MRLIQLLPLGLIASAFILPRPRDFQLNLHRGASERVRPFLHDFPTSEEIWEDFEDELLNTVKCAKHKFDDAVNSVLDTAVKYGKDFETAFHGDAWLETADYDLDLVDNPPPHHGPPHHGPPHKGPPGKEPPHKGPPGKKPPGKWPPHNGTHRRPHHKPSNLTVFQMIAKSNYTTKLAAAIGEFPDLVDLLNGTTANFTIFAPTDKAFAKIPKHAPKPSKEFLKKLLSYHVSPEIYPAFRVLASRTIPTALEAEAIGKFPQRISTQIGFRGLTLNYYARIVAVNIFGTNGVIHGLDSLLLPPPKITDILSLFPAEFSTLELALYKTGLFPYINDTATHEGGTFFAPSNRAFALLGPKANAFLFSKFGTRYLEALMKYHIVSNITLYSDAIYKTDSEESGHRPGPPRGFFHVDLPTLLTGKSLSIDIARLGRMITIKINGYSRVSVSDGVAADGVIHVVPHVLIPPKTPGMPETSSNEDISLEELKERLAPYVSDAEVEPKVDL